MGAPVVGEVDKSVLEDMVDWGGCKFANEMDGGRVFEHDQSKAAQQLEVEIGYGTAA